MQSKASMGLAHRRQAGLLLHISSLPSPEGIGTIGAEAIEVANWMAEAGFGLWQILPTGPTGYGNSPYAPHSSFAGNELFIDLRILAGQGLLNSSAIAELQQDEDQERVGFTTLKEKKLPLLKEAARTFLSLGYNEKQAYRRFLAEEEHWLDSYALFRVLAETFGDHRWYSHWPAAYAKKDLKTLQAFEEQHHLAIEVWRVLQFFFSEQWQVFRKEVNGRGIRLIGDVPIFVAADSADTWADPHLFKRNKAGQFDPVSGVPPDLFSDTGQRWGNPVYDWQALHDTDYQWWILRLKRLFALTDLVRIDHFRGFLATWEIAANQKTAEFGSWVKGRGEELFSALSQAFDIQALIAEDLGLMDDEVIALRDRYNLPGMKIFQFGFGVDEAGEGDYTHEFLPHNWSEAFVAYTGTHDNDTTVSWFESLSEAERSMVLTYLDCEETEVTDAMIRMMVGSCARMVIIPAQDLLQKGGWARFNYPSTCNDENWSWRLKSGELDEHLAMRMRRLLTIFNRL